MRRLVLLLVVCLGCNDAAPSRVVPDPVPRPAAPLPVEPTPQPTPAPRPDPPPPSVKPLPPFGWFFLTHVPGQGYKTGACPGSIHVVADGADGTYPFNPGLPIIATVRDPLGIGASYLKVSRGLLQYVLIEANGAGQFEEPATTNGEQWARAHGVGVMTYHDTGDAPSVTVVNRGDVFLLQAYPQRGESEQAAASRIAGHLAQIGGRVAVARALYTQGGRLDLGVVERFQPLLDQVLRETPANVVLDLGFSCSRPSGALDHPSLLPLVAGRN